MVCPPATLLQQPTPRNTLKERILQPFVLLDGCLIRMGVGKRNRRSAPLKSTGKRILGT